MKRKGFLKKMIGALCVAGVLIGMPVTANAANKEDVVGNWAGGPLSVSFYENGEARDRWNTRTYTMESGSLTVTYMSTGNTETVDYDLWRGEQIKDVDVDQYADAVIYKIIEPGKMQAWNIVKEEGSSDWISYDPSILTKVTQSNTNSGKCAHNYEWVTTTEPTETSDGVSSYRCMYCGDVHGSQPISKYLAVRNNLLADIKNAKAGATVTYNNKELLCYQQCVLDALKEKGDVSLRTDFTYKGVKYSFTIPAGSDYSNLEQADFYGFMYLLGAFGGTIVE